MVQQKTKPNWYTFVINDLIEYLEAHDNEHLRDLNTRLGYLKTWSEALIDFIDASASNDKTYVLLRQKLFDAKQSTPSNKA